MTPARVVLALGALLGVAFAFLTPPFQVPDEPQHFFRAFQVSELPLHAVHALTADRATPSPYRGSRLPKSLAQLVDSSEVTRTSFRPTQKVDPAKFLAGLRHPLNPAEREALGITPYPAAAYLPQAVGIGAGRLFGASPLVLFYLGRLTAVGVWVGLVFLAVRTTPVLRWTYFLLALMPMTLYVAASHSVDGLVIGASFLLSAQLLRWAYDPAKTRVTTVDLVVLAALALALMLSKPPYLLLLLLFLLVPGEKFGGRVRGWLALAGVIVVCLAAYALANAPGAPQTGPPEAAPRHGSASPLPDVSPSRQLAFIREHPRQFAETLVNTVATLHGFYLGSFVGVLGWLDTPLPPWLPPVYLGATVVVTLLSSGPPVGWAARGLALGIFSASSLVALVGIYMAFSTVGMKLVYGVQGRYFIPAAPMLFLVLKGRIPWRAPNVLAVALIALVVSTASIAGYRLVHRFYVAEVPSFGIDMLAASPGGDIVVIKGWAIDRRSDGVAAAVEVELDGLYYRTRYGLDRADIAAKLQKPAYRYSGFEVKIAVAKPGRHTLALRIVAKDQTSYMVPEAKLPLLLR